MPSSPSRQARTADLTALIARPFAHRGLHGDGRIENSRAAFEAAIAAGSGIELDVQASADGEAMVFHDYELDRLTDGFGALRTLGSAELQRVRLNGSDETIPTLIEILALIGGRTPLLIELKSPGRRVAQLCRAVKRALDAYQGPVAVMSFNPEIGHRFAREAPQVLRGLVVTEEKKRGLRGMIGRPLALWRSHADFLAYDIRDLPSSFAGAQRANGMKVLTWTVRTAADRARAAEHADQIIYEIEGPSA
jgi:glycerophosphoryl diester phosphodiesterase